MKALELMSSAVPSIWEVTAAQLKLTPQIDASFM